MDLITYDLSAALGGFRYDRSREDLAGWSRGETRVWPGAPSLRTSATGRTRRLSWSRGFHRWHKKRLQQPLSKAGLPRSPGLHREIGGADSCEEVAGRSAISAERIRSGEGACSLAHCILNRRRPVPRNQIRCA